jgi:3-oxoacyl-[acyl-carrier-protein] synthase II
MLAGLANMGPLSQRNDAPQAASRPFDADRAGLVFGEGAVVLVLEAAAHARARGARVYGEVAGGALTADAFHMSAPEPSGTYAAEAIRLALERSGLTAADVVVAGGADAGIAPVMLAGLANMGPLSQRNDAPQAASRPFDADRDGFVFGEGAVIAVLESAAHAAARGKQPYAVVAGGAMTEDAFHVSAPEPNARYATAAIEQALRRTEVSPAEVDYICAHGTSTKANDRTETMAIRAAFGTAAGDVAISSPKSMVGHLIGAAGALGALVCALAIRDEVVPPTINLHTPDPECDLDYVPNTARSMPVGVAATNAFGFGGQNVVGVFRRPPD